MRLMRLPGQAKSLLRRGRINAAEFTKLTALLLDGNATGAARADSEAASRVCRTDVVREAAATGRGPAVVGDARSQRPGVAGRHAGGGGGGGSDGGGGWLRRMDSWLSETVWC